ncbi:MAG: enoyl-CoA hydratase-related protein [Alphaproteobacteria bacterium]|nr:enoyl-CoA hydratase-related protein [Alphaproteobacteria bacterium]
MTYRDILYEVSDGVARITINRPEKLNAIRGISIDEICDAIRTAMADSDVGVLVLTGAGDRAFSSGGDVEWEAGGGLDGLNFEVDLLLLECPKPTVARVNGYAIAAGNHMAYFCDLTVAADHAIFGQNGPRVGSPAGGHPVSHLADIIGHKRAKELWMLCRRYTAAEMQQWGLVNFVVPMAELDAETDRVCKELLALSPTCLKTVKTSFTDKVDRTPNIDILNRVAPDYFETGEQQEGAAAFLEKRQPDFSPWR